MDAVYFTAGDAAAVRMARAAGKLVATVRARDALAASVELDMMVSSANDEAEQYGPRRSRPAATGRGANRRGGRRVARGR